MKTIHDAVLRPKPTPYTTKALLLEDLRLPIHIALGRYEAATQEELDELITDLTVEHQRRVS